MSREPLLVMSKASAVLLPMSLAKPAFRYLVLGDIWITTFPPSILRVPWA